MNAQMMNKNVKAVNDVTTPAPYFFYDHLREKIYGTEFHFKKSQIPGSAQDKALMCAKRAHPGYDYEIIKPKKEKNSYKGLKRELIHDYIECFGTDEMMEKFKEMKKESASFGSMKSWFLGQFPTFGNVEKAKKEIQKYRLDMFKEKYKVTVRTASKNSKPSSDASVQ